MQPVQPDYQWLKNADVKQVLKRKGRREPLNVVRDGSGGVVNAADQRLVTMKLKLAALFEREAVTHVDEHGFLSADERGWLNPKGYWRQLTTLAGVVKTPFFVPAFDASVYRGEYRFNAEDCELYARVARVLSRHMAFELPYLNNFASAGMPYPTTEAGVKMFQLAKGLREGPRHCQALLALDSRTLRELAEDGYIGGFNATNHRFQSDGCEWIDGKFIPIIRQGQTFNGEWKDDYPWTHVPNQIGTRDRPNQAGNAVTNTPQQGVTTCMRAGQKRRGELQLAGAEKGEKPSWLDSLKPQDIQHVRNVLRRRRGSGYKPYLSVLDIKKMEAGFSREITLLICCAMTRLPPALRLHVWLLTHGPLLLVDWNPGPTRWGYTGLPHDPLSFTRDGGNASGFAWTDLYSERKGIADVMLGFARLLGHNLDEDEIDWILSHHSDRFALMNIGDDNVAIFSNREDRDAFNRMMLDHPFAQMQLETPPKFAGLLIGWHRGEPVLSHDPRRYVGGLLEPERGVDSPMRRDFAGPGFHARRDVFSQTSAASRELVIQTLESEFKRTFGSDMVDGYERQDPSYSAIEADILNDFSRIMFKYDLDDVPKEILARFGRRPDEEWFKGELRSMFRAYERIEADIPQLYLDGLNPVAVKTALKYLSMYEPWSEL